MISKTVSKNFLEKSNWKIIYAWLKKELEIKKIKFI